MCLAVPGKVLNIDNSGSMRMGTVSFGGVRKQICLDWVPEVRVGEYVLAHVGFALAVIDEKEALATLDMLSQMEAGSDETGDDGLPSGSGIFPSK